MFWESVGENSVRCSLCAHRCVIKEGQRGVCRVRLNRDGVLYTTAYGAVTSIASDPIEKKPLYHFHPGDMVFSIGTASCNFRCPYCQNYLLAAYGFEHVPYKFLGSGTAVEEAIENGCKGVAYTYNEPTIWYEYTYDTSKTAHERGLYTIYVTNGYITEEPLRKIAPHLDAMNIDVKGDGEFYKKICRARLKPVLETCEMAKELGIHLELTYLIIPAYNDSGKKIEQFCDFVSNALGRDVPVHFSRFFPYYRMENTPPTPLSTMKIAYSIAKAKKLEFVYLGNVPDRGYNSTYCPDCNNLLIERGTFSSEMVGLDGGRCSRCNRTIPLVI